VLSSFTHRRIASLTTALAALATLSATGSASAATLGAGPNTEAGYAVATDGNTVVVGDPGAAGDKGAVEVFDWVAGTWTRTATLIAADVTAGDRLGASVAIQGDTIVAGAPGHAGDQGAIYTFARADRSQTAELTAGAGAPGDALGTSLAIDGDTVVAGAPGHDAGRGAVALFDRTGQTAELAADGGAPGDHAGAAVAIGGDTVVAGAPGADVVYTFARTGPATRTQTASLTSSAGRPSDRLGAAVAIDGDTIVAGAPGTAIGAASDRGVAYTFSRTGPADRTQTAELVATDGRTNDLLGTSVAIAGGTILVGAPLHQAGARSGGGAVLEFAIDGQPLLTQTAELAGPRARRQSDYGFSVALAGDTLVAGAPGAGVATVVSRAAAATVRRRKHGPARRGSARRRTSAAT
jgi:hypothetical protein